MKKSLLLFLFFPLCLLAGNKETDWIASGEPSPRFIENRSQFDGKDKLSGSKILFGIDQGAVQVYFTKKGLTYRFDRSEKKYKRTKEEKRKDREKFKTMTAEEFIEHEKRQKATTLITDLIHMQWSNANPAVEIIAQDLSGDYFSYTKSNGENINYIKGYKKIVYKNLYPNIDVEYVFHPKGGIKYDLILHPGADPSVIKMIYSDAGKISLDQEGNIRIRTLFGDMIDHAPLSFYSKDKKSIVASSFVKNGSEVSFALGNYDKTKTLVIDPWTQTPAVTAPTGVWEVEVDGAGNVYVIGGGTPMRLMKYSSAGAIQWTYVTPYDTSNGDWLGALATDNAGNSYVTRGSSAAIVKVNNAGGQVYSVNGGALDEYWQIAFNCDQTKLLIGGTRLPFFPTGTYQSAMIFDVNPATGAVTNTVFVGYSRPGFFGTPGEVRAITSSFNARYYYMTLDTLAAIDQGLGTVCPTPGPLMEINHGYNFNYKCEDFRPDNGNGPISALVADANFLYTQNGATVHKRDLNTGVILATASIPGGISTAVPIVGGNQAGNSGIAMDNCGNVYVGSSDRIIKYDGNLVLQSQTVVPYRVSDVEVNSNNEVVLCGSTGTASSTTRTGYVQSVNMTSCAPITLVCCDANFCPVGPFCTTDGAVTLTPNTSGGTWSGTGITNTTTGVFNPSVAGSGTFIITYTLGCGTGSMQIIVKSCATPTVCIESNGDLTASGGTGPYHWDAWTSGGSTPITTQAQCTACNASYTWIGFSSQCLNGFTPVSTCSTAPSYQQFATGPTATPPGTWPIRVVDNNGNSLVINSVAGIPPCVPSTMSVTATQTNPNCNGQCTGTATVNQTGGTPPLTYTWNTSPVQTTQTATGLCMGSYAVVVKDAGTNTVTVNVSITQPTAITSSVTTTNTTCGASTGTASVAASGGTGSFTYAWNTGPTTASVSGLSVGNYTCIITDANGCTHAQTANILNTNGPAASIASQTNPTCNGSSNGSASSTATGGTSPYTFVWNTSPAQSTQNATGLAAGSYSVTVFDASGCSHTQAVTITGPAAITATTTITAASCGQNDGTATVTASGGSSPYSYVWSASSQTTQTITGLAVGNYSVVITDANGCSQTSTAAIVNANGPTALAGTSATIVAGGSAPLTASGGVTYVWIPATGLSDPNISNPTASPSITTTYCVFVSDANNCTDSACVTIYLETPCGDIFVPNAFSPNGDGQNHLECVLGNCIETLKFAIYDRWGERVFETTDAKICWDGVYKGKLMNTAVFVYYLDATLTTGEKISRKGNITLIR